MHKAKRPVPELRPINTSKTWKCCAMMLQRGERAKYEPSHYIPTLPASTSSYGQWRRKFLQIALVFICGSVGDRSFIKAWAVLLLHQGC